MKKFGLVLLLLIVALVGCAEATPEDGDANGTGDGEGLRVALVLPERIGVNPFFQQMDEGAKRAGEEFGIEVRTIESTDRDALEENLRVAVAEGYDLIITATFQAEDQLTAVSTENPEQMFAIIDTALDLPNVRNVVFREHEAAYLLGAAAGLITETDTVGMIVAMDVPLLSKYSSGFEQGLEATNANASSLINYVGGFEDPATAKELAILQHDQGADFIAGMSAVGDLGVFEAAKENGFYTSGQDVDQTVVDPEHVVLSQLKGTDAAAYETIKDFAEGNFDIRTIDYGLAEGGVGLTFVTHESESPLSPFVGEDVIEQLKAIYEEIVAGERVVSNPLAN